MLGIHEPYLPKGYVPSRLVTDQQLMAAGLDPSVVRELEKELEGMGLGLGLSFKGIFKGIGKGFKAVGKGVAKAGKFVVKHPLEIAAAAGAPLAVVGAKAAISGVGKLKKPSIKKVKKPGAISRVLQAAKEEVLPAVAERLPAVIERAQAPAPPSPEEMPAPVTGGQAPPVAPAGGLPPWALPVGIGIVALALLGGRR